MQRTRTTDSAGAPSLRLSRSLPFVVLALGLALSVVLLVVMHQGRRALDRAHFVELVDAAQRSIDDRVAFIEETLRSGVALFAASYSVELHEWRSYIGKIGVTDRVPGVNCVGVIHAVAPEDAEAFTALRRADDEPGFTIHPFQGGASPGAPAGAASGTLMVHTFIEPAHMRFGLIGADVSGNPARADAAARARDTGTFAMSPPIKLVQDGEQRPGFLMFAPVYRNSAPTGTVAERRAAIEAWVYAPVVYEDLLRPMIDGLGGGIDLQFYAGSAPDPAAMLFDFDGAPGHEFDLVTSMTLDGNGFTLAWRRIGERPLTLLAPSALPAGVAALVAALVAGLVASVQSTARRAHAHRDLERRFSAFMDHSPMAAWIKDEQLRYVFVNRHCAESFGRPRQSILGHDDYQWLGHDEAQRVREFDLTVLGRNEPIERVERFSSPDGEREWLILKFPLTDAAGARLIGGVGIDITVRQRALEELERARVSAEAASRAKSEFLANMSHEIRTPMTAILGFTDLLDDDQSPPGERREWVEAIRRSGKHLLTIINDILDLSKIHAEKLVVAAAPCSVPAVVAEAASLVRPQAIEKGLDLRICADGPMPRVVQTDPTRLRQILLNILGNAIKFTEPSAQGGVVNVTIGMLDAPEHPDPRMRIAVTDTGVGLTGEQIERIFEPFVQADTTSTRRHGGTGLGLSISRRLARLLGGDVEAHSVPGRGATFTITFKTGPLGAAELLGDDEFAALTRSPGGADAPPPLGEVVPGKLDGRVLLVEDGPDNQRLLTVHLRRAGLVVDIACNGREGVDMARASARENDPYALILMDMQMPVMDGYEATRTLREQGWRGPIVALTAHAMTGDDARCLSAGCDAYTTKPIARDKLLATCAKWLAAGSGAAA